MSKKSTKTKAPKAASKPKAKKGKAAEAAPQAAEQQHEVAEATAAPSAEVQTAAAETGPAAPTEPESKHLQIKKDANGRFWVVPKDSGAEHGPYDTKQQANDAKAAIAIGATPAAADEAKPAKAKKAKEPKAKRVSAIDAAAQVLAASTEPMNCMALVEAMATQGL